MPGSPTPGPSIRGMKLIIVTGKPSKEPQNWWPSCGAELIPSSFFLSPMGMFTACWGGCCVCFLASFLTFMSGGYFLPRGKDGWWQNQTFFPQNLSLLQFSSLSSRRFTLFGNKESFKFYFIMRFMCFQGRINDYLSDFTNIKVHIY